MAMARMCKLPTLLMPNSWSSSPLRWGIGVSPARAATSRRLRKARQQPSAQAHWQRLSIPQALSLNNFRKIIPHLQAHTLVGQIALDAVDMLCALLPEV